MTITTKPELPGAKSFARGGFRLSPLTDTHNPAGAFADATVKQNLAVGRRGQLMVIDRIDMIGMGMQVAVPQVLVLRCSNYAGTAGDELHFSMITVGGGLNHSDSIPHFGYVNQPVFTEPSIVPGGSNQFEANNTLGYYVMAVSSGGEDTLEMMLPGLRHVERNSAFSQGIVPGAWGSRIVYLAAVGLGLENYITNGELIPAPGADKMMVLRTLCIGSAIGATSHYRVGVGYSDVGSVVIAGGSSTTVLNVTSPTLVANAHVGMMVVIITGNRRAEVRQITANTTTTITVGVAFSGAPAAADTIQIINPMHEWVSAVAVPGFRAEQWLTDLNIPVPQNKALWFYAEATASGGAGAPTSDFDNKLSVVAGCEVRSATGHTFVNLTGAPA